MCNLYHQFLKFQARQHVNKFPGAATSPTDREQFVQINSRTMKTFCLVVETKAVEIQCTIVHGILEISDST